jgi:sensor histidine kinase YesM
MPRGTPSSSAKIRSPFNTLYFYCFMHYAFFLERLVFIFQFCLILFSAINGWTPTNFFWRSCLAFHLPRTLCFSLLSFNESSLFRELRLAFIFRLDFCLDLVLSLYQGVFWPLVHVGFHKKSCFKKVWMVLEKRKIFMQKKSGTKRSLFRLRLRLLHVVLDIVLIVCLVIFAVAWLVSNDWDCLMSL